MIKSPSEWQMVDQPSGEGRERGHPTVTKVFGVRGQASICFGLRGHSFAGRDLLPWCVLLTFATCGWIFISDWLRNKEDLLQIVSMTDPLHLTHTHKHIYTHTLGGIHKFHWSLHNNNIQVFFFYSQTMTVLCALMVKRSTGTSKRPPEAFTDLCQL